MPIILVITAIVFIVVLLTATEVAWARQLRTFYQQSPAPTLTFTPTPVAPTETPTAPPPTETPTAPPPTETPTAPPPTETPTAPPPTETPTPIPPTETSTPTPTNTPLPPTLFVTGGGWFNSPAGAYTPDPDLVGQASFGFASKYTKGASAPTGQTQFQFHAAGLNFHSNSYQWLVIDENHRSAQFMGTGTIRGSQQVYPFIIWAEDEPDRMRIKIWRDTPAGEDVVYHNAGGSPLSGGSITIHNDG